MKILSLPLLLLCLTGGLIFNSCSQSPAYQMFSQPYSPRIANHFIVSQFDPHTRLIRGSVRLEWRNTTTRVAVEMPFHLYMNAFRDENSTFLQELGEIPDILRDNWGYCDIRKILLPDGRDLTDSLRFLPPDDGNVHDQTVVLVPLPEPVLPGQNICLTIEFETKLPALTERSGFWNDYYLVAQWFPKVGVFTDEGWVCPQYHANTEFFADFGVYDVSITLPANLTVGATGVQIEERILENDQKSVRFFAEDVHDFAWCAAASLVEFVETVGDLEIRLLMMPRHLKLAERILYAAKAAYQYYSAAFGEYPYPTLTIIDTPVENAVMEYPMLFFTGNFDGINYGAPHPHVLPESNRFPERLTMHEFAHQWWYGMSANNEVSAAWLDEGLAEYATNKAFEATYGKLLLVTVQGDSLPIRDFHKKRYTEQPDIGIIDTVGWAHPTFAAYYALNYVKPKLLLHTLDNYFGEEKCLNLLRDFFQRWRFGHPEPADFWDALRAHIGEEWMAFFHRYFHTTDYLDYEIFQVENNRVEIRNAGSLGFPVDIVFHFADGQRIKKQWDGHSATVRFDFSDRPDLHSVEIDPDRVIEFETRTDNNRWRRTSS